MVKRVARAESVIRKRQTASRHGHEHWARVVAEWKESELTRRTFCASRGIKPATLSWWCWRLKAGWTDWGSIGKTRSTPVGGKKLQRQSSAKRKASTAVFLPVSLVDVHAGGDAMRVDQTGMVEIVLSGTRSIRVRPGFDEATLARVVAALEKIHC